jgi:hypothetical protein
MQLLCCLGYLIVDMQPPDSCTSIQTHLHHFHPFNIACITTCTQPHAASASTSTSAIHLLTVNRVVVLSSLCSLLLPVLQAGPHPS